MNSCRDCGAEPKLVTVMFLAPADRDNLVKSRVSCGCGNGGPWKVHGDDGHDAIDAWNEANPASEMKSKIQHA